MGGGRGGAGSSRARGTSQDLLCEKKTLFSIKSGGGVGNKNILLSHVSGHLGRC